MYGVVLWSNNEDNKAVIWCEDHGDLAFYSATGQSALEGPDLDAGDLVRFSLAEGEAVRMATDPTLVAEQEYPGLADRLMAKGGPSAPSGAAAAEAPAGNSNVIAFDPRRVKPRLAS